MKYLPVAVSAALLSLTLAAPATWAQTAPANPMTLNETPGVVAHSSNQGAAPSNTPLSLVLDFQSQNAQGLAAYAQGVDTPSSPDYRHFLSHAAMLAEFGPDPTDVQATETYLQAQGWAVQPTPQNTALAVHATVGQIDSVLGARINRYSYQQKQYLAPSGPITLPPSMPGVLNVEGLSTYNATAVPATVTAPDVAPPDQQTDPTYQDQLWLQHLESAPPISHHPAPVPVVTPALATPGNTSGSGAETSDSVIWWTTPSGLFEPVGTSETLTVQVVNAVGDPVDEAGLSVEMTQTQMAFSNVTGQASSAQISANAGSAGTTGADVTALTNTLGQVTFTVTDAANETVGFSAGLTTSTGAMYGVTASAQQLLWYQPNTISIAPIRTSAATGQNIDFSASVTANGAALPHVSLFPDVYSSSDIYFGGTAGDSIDTNGSGATNGWLFSPTPASGPIEVLGATNNGTTWYEGASSASVSWTGNTVTEQSPVPGDASAGEISGITPQAVDQAYDATSLTADASDAQAKIGIYAESSYTPADIATFFQSLEITAPTITVVPVDGTSSQIEDLAGWHGELELDLELAGAVAPGAQLTAYTLAEGNSSSTLDPIDVATTVVDDDAVNVMLFSMTMPEDALSPAYLNAWNQVLAEGTAEGISFVAASGDTGAYNDTANPGVATVGFPASDPYVTAVGGTQLGVDAATGSLDSQTAWSPNGAFDNGLYDLPSASGGGYSGYFFTPSYQSTVNTNPMRGVPDVAFMATFPWYLSYNSNDYTETNTGNFVNGWYGVGGTSASNVLWAGYLADVIAQSGPLGNANPTIYQVDHSDPSTFSSVTQGNNGVYQAGPGWNPVTGLGSINIDAFAADLQTATLTGASATQVTAGQSVTLNGTGFGASQGAGYVAFSDNGTSWGAPGDAASFQITSWSNTAITFMVPTPSGSNGQWAVTPGTTATVTVTNGSGQPTDSVSLPVLSNLITGITPSSGATAGQTVTLTGANFGTTEGSSYVQFLDEGTSWGAPSDAATFQITGWSNTAITFMVPTPSGSNGQWAVTPGSTATATVVIGGAAGNAIPLSIVGLTVTGVTPTSQFPGQTVTVAGDNFGATQGNGYVAFTDNGVNWGAPGNAATFQLDSWSNTAITFTIPLPSGSNGSWAVQAGTVASFTVTNNAGVTSVPQTVTITNPPPAISSVSPTSAAAGQTLTVTGTNFGDLQSTGYLQFSDNGVGWGAPSDAATFQITSWSNTAITFTVPTPSGPNGQWAVAPGTMATLAVTNSTGQTSAPGTVSIASNDSGNATSTVASVYGSGS